MTPDEFWSLTPFETYEWCRSVAVRECREYKRTLYGAWHSAVFQRQKKVPDLAKLMDRLDNPVPQQQTPEVLMNKVKMLATVFGGRLENG